MATEQIALNDILSIESDEQMVEALSKAIGFHSCKKDPEGGRFYYLRPTEGDIRPIAVGLFDELQGNDKQALKAKLMDRKDKLYIEIYGHYLNRQMEAQPVLYLLLPKGHKRGLMALIKPTDSGLKVKEQLLLETDERDVAIKLNLLRTKCPIRKSALVDAPNIDHLFYDPVDTAEDLAKELARITRKLEQEIIQLYEKEQVGGFLHQLHKSFKAELLPHLKLTSDDPKEYGFADLYAQTVSYGMFTGRCFKPTQAFERRAVSKFNIPPTNPFLKNLFESISDETQAQQAFYAPLFDLIEDLVGCLSSTDMEAILADFSYDKTHHEDIVIHFYETFLREYNPRQREIRGVYYTPYPVVSYIVRSVDIILKDKFKKPLGLADPEVLVLDPATGTGTFLFAVFKHLEEFYKTQVDKRAALSWNEFVDTNILPRLFGFELMMAPYAVAHLRLGVELQESGYEFRDDTQRLGVYLTNTLDETAKKSETFFEEFIASESSEAAEIKREKPIMVIVGNPPYSGHSANAGQWMHNLIRGVDTLGPQNQKTENYFEVNGQPLGERNPKWLNDDYVKFIRFAQWRIDKTGHGIVAFITNHGYLDNPTFRGMRQSLLSSFNELYVLDLHGNSKKKELCPDGSKDENVFDIQQGVAIGLFVKNGSAIPESGGKVYHSDIWGLREQLEKGKYSQLILKDLNKTKWLDPESKSPHYLFKPLSEAAQNSEEDYQSYWKITDIFPVNGWGIATRKDYLLVDFDQDSLKTKFEDIAQLGAIKAKEKYKIKDSPHWDFSEALTKIPDDRSKSIRQALFRPFDLRYIFYEKCMIERGDHRYDLMSNMFNDNLSLITVRRTETKCPKHFFCTNLISVLHSTSSKEGNFIFPLYLYQQKKTDLLDLEFANEKKRVSNLSNAFIRAFSQSLNLSFVNDGSGDLESSFGPDDIFYYLYAFCFSNLYRDRYAEFLQIDFPKFPITSKPSFFRLMVILGEQITKSHLMEFETELSSYFPISGSNKIDRITYTPSQLRVWINKTQYFESVPQSVWEFHIGGYQVCEKWLKDRKLADRTLSDEDIQHYRKIVATLQDTISLMAQIDEVIEEHGGWPIQ